jgi:hypothetical protein
MKITLFLGMAAMVATGTVSAAGRELSPAGVGAPPTSIHDYYGGHGHSMRPES